MFTEIANCEADIAFYAERQHAATREWLLQDFKKWFSDPGDSRAYVLLGDPGVGKSVMAGVLAQRSRKVGHLGAAHFCRHNDNTRNDPRCLLGTIASQLCECSSEYNSIMGGEGGIRKLLGNSNLGVQELFTKLLQEPLGKCNSTFCHQRKLVVVDALDETQYESREDFLDLIMNRFPVLPHWLVFFITSRPENTVQLSLKKYNPCVRICAGNVEHDNFYQQHEQDIKLFLRNSVDFSRLPFSVDDVATKCNGSFLYAFYIAKDLNASMQSGKSFQLVDLFPGDFDNFLRKNFKRVFEKVGCSLFKKLFGCAIAAPAPLPVSFISYVLQREKLQIRKQHVLDALSLFMVLSKTFTFLHNLIPAWLTDGDKAQELFIDRNVEANYLKDVIHEILFGFSCEESQDVALIKPEFLDYALRVGIRFLSGFPGSNLLETVFSCLTSFKYIEKRIQSRRIEVFSLIEDYKLAADCQFEGRKKEIIFEVCSALEKNIYVLLECPYLLHCCLQNSNKVVQDNVIIPDDVSDVSATWLQLNSMPLPSTRHRDMSSCAVSPDGRLLAERHEKHISLFDSCSLKCVNEFSSRVLETNLVSTSKCLEFSPDGKFLFFGRLDRWFSLNEEDVKEFPQFSRINSSYEWGSFTLDKQWIVVKLCQFSFESNESCCWLCLLNNLCLWAAEEISQSRETDESETICGCFPDRLRVSVPSVVVDHHTSVPGMKILLDILRRTHHDKWCSLFDKLQLHHPFKEDTCIHCPSRGKTPTLTFLRDFVIDHYNKIFDYQVWNVQTGRSALEQAFFSGAQLSPFTYLCHLGTSLEKCGVLFSGIDKSLSLCNVALLSTVCHHLSFFEYFCRKGVSVMYEKEEVRVFEFLERLEQRLQPKEKREFERIFEGSYVGRLGLVSPKRCLKDVLEMYDEEDEEGEEDEEELREFLQLFKQCLQPEELRISERIFEGLRRIKFRPWLKRRLQPEDFRIFEWIFESSYVGRLGLMSPKRCLKDVLGMYDGEDEEGLRKFKFNLWFKAGRLQPYDVSVFEMIFESSYLGRFGLVSKRCPKDVLEMYDGEDKEDLRQFKFLQRLEQRLQPGELSIFESYVSRLGCVSQDESLPGRFAQFKQLRSLSCYHWELEKKFKFVEAFHFGTKAFTNAPLELQNLSDANKKGLFTSILPCVSADGKWIAIRLEGDETTVQLYEQPQRRSDPYWTNPVHVLKEIEQFAFTNNSVFFLYLTVQRSLHTLSLATGTNLTSVSGVRPLPSSPEKQAGYCFQDDKEKNIIFLKDFASVFLSSLLTGIKIEPMQVAFASADAILVLYSDSMLALMENDGKAIALEMLLTLPFGVSQQAKNGQFSPDGKVIAIHQGTKILLYRTVPGSNEMSTNGGKCPDSVFEASDDFIVLHFTFSADSKLLLFCIRRSTGQAFFVWNVQMKELLDLSGLMSEDCCCCFSLGSNKLIICSEVFIGFWVLDFGFGYDRSPSYWLERKVENYVPYTEFGKFTHCTVSPENDLLAYCIADRIFLCPLKTDQSTQQLPRAHKGKVEFCQFLRGNRYLISYGVDGIMFLWDLSEWKAVAFTKIAQGLESIVSIALSAEGDKVVCVTSSGRLNVLKPCGLKDAKLSKLPLPKELCSDKVTEAFCGQARELTTAIQNLQCPGNTEALDVAELRIEETEFYTSSDDNEYSDEDSDKLLA